MTDTEARYYNALNVFYAGDYRSLDKAIKKHGSWFNAWENLGPQTKLDPESEWKRLENHSLKIMMAGDSKFPAPLKEIPWPPFALYYKGNFPFPGHHIAIVGTRKATLAGKEIAKKFAGELSINGVIIVSGLALGIDSAAHEGAVAAGAKTVAVLATGLDTVYPPQNYQLAKTILDKGGAIISEYPIGSPSYPARFIERNRLISGLSLGAVVIEAPEESGALATARFAVEQNRDVFVVPGPINHPNYIGSHSLVKSGAALVTSVQDVVDALNLKTKFLGTEKEPENWSGLGKEEARLANFLKDIGKPLEIDKIGELLQIEPSTASRLLTFLLIKGIIKESGGRYYL